MPPPQWPPRVHTVGSFLRAATLPMAIVVGVSMMLIGLFLGLIVLLPLLAFVVPLVAPLGILFASRRSAAKRQAALVAEEAERAAKGASLEESPAEFFSTSTAASRARRTRIATELLDDVSSRAVGRHSTPFNEHVSTATGLAIYGCGVTPSPAPPSPPAARAPPSAPRPTAIALNSTQAQLN